MLTWSAKRRLWYFALSVIAIGALAFFIFFVYRPTPNCFDGRQNGTELGVDCGGDCARVCPFEVADLKIIWSRPLAVGGDRYDAITLVENPNPAHGVKDLKYQIKVLDDANLLITTVIGETSINPGERLVIFSNRLKVGHRVPARTIFELSEPPWWTRVAATAPILHLTSQSFNNLPTPRLVATLNNRSGRNLSNIEIVVLLSDAEANAEAASATLVPMLNQDAAAELVFTWPVPLSVEPAFIDFYPHLPFGF